MKKAVTTLLVLIAAVLAWWQQQADPNMNARKIDQGGLIIEAAYQSKKSDFWVEFEAQVSHILSDDDYKPRHQRFIVEFPSGHTLLIAHNIDLAPRVPVIVGDRVQVFGEYEWNDRGGVMHWTHKHPDGSSKGWIRHEGLLYE